MERRNLNRKRLLAIIIALGILLVTAFGNLFIDQFKISQLEDQIENEKWLDQFAGGSSVDHVLQGTDAENRIAVFSIEGAIGDENADPFDSFLSGEMEETTLEFVKEDPTIRGVLLNVDSPGGTVYHSVEIWETVKEIQEELDIPVYTSMGEVAASGGYYVAAPSDKIFATEETITGSIGVISDYINIEELEEKLGIKHNVIKSGKHKDIGSANREMTDEEREINQDQVDEFFDKFVEVVADGRELDEEYVRDLADGRVYTGKQAVENGLVDEIGRFDDALNTMVDDLGLEDPEVFEKTVEPSVWGQFLTSIQEINPMSSHPDQDSSFEAEAFKYIEENRTEGHLPEFYYLYGGF